jgi:hypothetical protein
MRHWTFWEWLAYACLFLGAMILAADTGIRLAPELGNLLPFIHGPAWGFAPLAFLLLATVILLAREFDLLGATQRTAHSADIAPSPPSAAPGISTEQIRRAAMGPNVKKWMTPYEAMDAFVEDDLKQAYVSALAERNDLEKRIEEINKTIPVDSSLDVLRELHGELPDDGSPRSERKKLNVQLGAASNKVFSAYWNLRECLKDKLKMGTLVARGVLIEGDKSSDDWVYIKSAHWALLDFQTGDKKLETASGGGRNYKGIQVGEPR